MYMHFLKSVHLGGHLDRVTFKIKFVFGPSATSFDTLFLWYMVDFPLNYPFNLYSTLVAYFGCFLI